MSTVVLYHGFGVRGYRHEKTEVVEGRVVMRLLQSKESCRCSARVSREVVLSGVSEREFRSVPIGRQPVTIVLPIPRVACQAFGAASGRHVCGATSELYEIVCSVCVGVVAVDDDQRRGLPLGRELGHN